MKWELCHRDICPSNCLIQSQNNRYILKLGDFGMARPCYSYDEESVECDESFRCCKNVTGETGTLQYKAPEVLLGGKTIYPCIDVWSSGLVIAEMSNGGKQLLPGQSHIMQWSLVKRLLGDPDTQEWPEVTQLKDFYESPSGKLIRVEKASWIERKCPLADEFVKEVLERTVVMTPWMRSSAQSLSKFCLDNIEKQEGNLYLEIESCRGRSEEPRLDVKECFEILDSLER